MKKPKLLLASLLASLAFAASAVAQTTLLSTDFQSHATAAATAGSLDAVTTGGSWSLNPRTVGAAVTTSTIEEDGAGAETGDKALLLDFFYDGSTNITPGEFATVSLTSPAGFATEAVTITTASAARRIGGGRDLLFEFLGKDASDNPVVAATILWQPLGGSNSNNISFNGAGAQAATFGADSAWDTESLDVNAISAVFSAGGVTLNFRGLSSGRVSVLNNATSLTGLRISNGGSGPSAGLFLDDLTVSSQPAVTTLLSTNFQAHVTASPNDDTADNATDASLNAVTTGGTWTLNQPRADTVYGIREDEMGDPTGDKALFLDDGATNTGATEFATLSLTSPAGLAAAAVTVTTASAARRVGGGRDLLFEFLGKNASDNPVVAATILWQPLGGTNNNISFNGAAAQAASFGNDTAWNTESPDVKTLSAVFSGSSVTLNFAGLSSGTVSVLNGATSFTGLRISNAASATTQGLFLDDITITSEPVTPPPPPPPTAVVTTADYHYRGLADVGIDDPDRIRVYFPPSNVTGVETRPAIMMIHGGNWLAHGVTQFNNFCKALAEMGFVTASPNYRLRDDAAASAYPETKELCLDDTRLALAWLAERSSEFGFASNQIILGGGSAGGHLATMLALQPDEFPAAISNLTIPAMILYNPAYDESETSDSVSLRVDPERQLAELVANSQQPPPGIFFFGNYDRWRTPLSFTGDGGETVNGMGRALPFIGACRTAGVEAELWYAPGQNHGFFNPLDWTQRCIVEVDAFLRAQGITPASAPPAEYAHPELPLVLGTDIHPWRLQWFGNEFATGNADDGANPDGDSLTNLQEFAFGTDPTASTPESITYQIGGNVTKPGLPVASNFATGEGVDFRAIFGRRKDQQAIGLAYNVQFSADLENWVTGTDSPTVLTGAGNTSDIEAVSVPYPLFIQTSSGYKKPGFFRVGVSQP